MKCIAEGCQGTAISGNYCALHKRRTGSPRPGVSGFFRIGTKNQITKIKEINAREELEARLGGKIKKKPKGVVLILSRGGVTKLKSIKLTKTKSYSGPGGIKRSPRNKKFENN